MRFFLTATFTLLILAAPLLHAAGENPPPLKTEHFDRDPGWEGHNNRVVPKTPLHVKQDFGYSATNFAGKAAGEMGGAIQRSTTPVSYGDTENFVGIHVGGPTRIGHCFIPAFATAKGTIGKVKHGPILKPGKALDWSLIYDPGANGGNAEMRVTLGTKSVTLALKPGQKAQGASMDRFGLFTSTAGGQRVKIYLDDLQYSAGKQ